MTLPISYYTRETFVKIQVLIAKRIWKYGKVRCSKVSREGVPKNWCSYQEGPASCHHQSRLQQRKASFADSEDWGIMPCYKPEFTISRNGGLYVWLIKRNMWLKSFFLIHITQLESMRLKLSTSVLNLMFLWFKCLHSLSTEASERYHKYSF